MEYYLNVINGRHKCIGLLTMKKLNESNTSTLALVIFQDFYAENTGNYSRKSVAVSGRQDAQDRV